MSQSADLLVSSHRLCSINVKTPVTKLSNYDMHACFLQVAIFNTELSVENFKAAMSIPAALGLDPTVANSGNMRTDNILLFSF